MSFQSETGEEQNDAEGRGQQREEKIYAHGGEEVCICHCLRSLALRKASETRKPSISNDEDLGRERTGVFVFSLNFKVFHWCDNTISSFGGNVMLGFH